MLLVSANLFESVQRPYNSVVIESHATSVTKRITIKTQPRTANDSYIIISPAVYTWSPSVAEKQRVPL